jgi:hypothetical protein
LGNERKDGVILKAYIEAIVNNAFVRSKTYYLCINLIKSGDKDSGFAEKQYSDSNSLVVYEFIDGKFIQSNNQLLKARNFSSSFILSEVILEGEKSITSGNILIPFYSDGSSESFKLKVLSGDSPVIITKNKNSKSVLIQNGI